MPGCIAVINAGSSSIKFTLCEATHDASLLFRGQVEGIGVSPHLKVTAADGTLVAERNWPAGELDHDAATREILRICAELIAGTRVLGVGHRVVHGGMAYSAPVRVTPDVLATLAQLVPLAPLHQPHNLAPIR